MASYVRLGADSVNILMAGKGKSQSMDVKHALACVCQGMAHFALSKNAGPPQQKSPLRTETSGEAQGWKA